MQQRNLGSLQHWLAAAKYIILSPNIDRPINDQRHVLTLLPYRSFLVHFTNFPRTQNVKNKLNKEFFVAITFFTFLKK